MELSAGLEDFHLPLGVRGVLQDILYRLHPVDAILIALPDGLQGLLVDAIHPGGLVIFVVELLVMGILLRIHESKQVLLSSFGDAAAEAHGIGHDEDIVYLSFGHFSLPVLHTGHVDDLSHNLVEDLGVDRIEVIPEDDAFQVTGIVIDTATHEFPQGEERRSAVGIGYAGFAVVVWRIVGFRITWDGIGASWCHVYG